MRGFALGLGLAENFFLRSDTRPLSRASYVYYPPQPANAPEDSFGVGPHTDFGVLTVLCQDSVGGLQVQLADGRWLNAPREADAPFIETCSLPDPLLYHRGVYFPLDCNNSPARTTTSSTGGGTTNAALPHWRPCHPLPRPWFTALWRADDEPMAAAALAKVRAAAVGYVRAAIAVPYKAKWRGAGTDAIVDLIGYMAEDTIPIAAFYGGHTSVNYLAELTGDPVAAVRLDSAAAFTTPAPVCSPSNRESWDASSLRTM